MRAKMNRLAGALERLVEQVRAILVAPAWPLRVRVGADHAQQAGAVAAAIAHADMRHDSARRAVQTGGKGSR